MTTRKTVTQKTTEVLDLARTKLIPLVNRVNKEIPGMMTFYEEHVSLRITEVAGMIEVQILVVFDEEYRVGNSGYSVLADVFNVEVYGYGKNMMKGLLALERCMKTEIKALEAVIKTMDAAPEKTKPPCADKIVEIDGKKFKLTPL